MPIIPEVIAKLAYVPIGVSFPCNETVNGGSPDNIPTVIFVESPSETGSGLAIIDEKSI